MATFEELLKEIPWYCDASKHLKENPSVIEQVLAPLTQAGFMDFTYVAKGTNALFFAPSDNDKIVFRISTEWSNRRDNVPFFLASPYEHNVESGNETVKLELLLAGKKDVSEEQKAELLHEMEKAGWKTRSIEHINGSFWKDVIVVPFRGKDGRMRNVPIISDPSASTNHLLHAMPFGDQIRSCSSQYITLQDQADAYTQAINQDPRLKKIVPHPVAFPETIILPEIGTTPSQSY